MEITSGVTLVNLACTGNPNSMVKHGWMVNIVGDSNTGKSFLARTILAANYYKYKQDLVYVYDDLEHGVHWDDSRLFGEDFATNALEPQFEYKERTLEEWFNNFNSCVTKSLKEKRPFIFVLDSWDSINAAADNEYISAIAGGKDKKSMGMAKAKLGSKILSDVVSKLEATKSCLFIISQTRDNIDPMSFETRVRSGGRALRFYSSLEVWLACKGKLRLDNTTDPYGIQVSFKQKRSRLLGHESVVEFPVTYVYGVDETQSNIEYLVKHNKIQREGNSYLIPTLDIKCAMRKLAAVIEEKGLQDTLAAMVAETWVDNETTLADRILQGRVLRFK